MHRTILEASRMRAKSIQIAQALGTVVLIWLGAVVSAADLPDPTRPGPYPVGVTTIGLFDHSRTDEATQGGPRALLTEIWYPATEDTRDLPKNKASDFLVRRQLPMLNQFPKIAFGMDIDKFDETFENFAVRDARVRDGKFPLVVFSHGNGGMRNQSTFWCDHLASHGDNKYHCFSRRQQPVGYGICRYR